jgi:hypothetical protein
MKKEEGKKRKDEIEQTRVLYPSSHILEPLKKGGCDEFGI